MCVKRMADTVNTIKCKQQMLIVVLWLFMSPMSTVEQLMQSSLIASGGGD